MIKIVIIKGWCKFKSQNELSKKVDIIILNFKMSENSLIKIIILEIIDEYYIFFSEILKEGSYY